MAPAMAPFIASPIDDGFYTAAGKNVQHHNISFPNPNRKYYKKFWPKFLRRPEDQPSEVPSAKPLVSQISPPLMYISGVSNDFSTVTGQWKLCEIHDPEMCEQQRAVLRRVSADDRSMLLRSSSKKIDIDALLAKMPTNTTNEGPHLYRGSAQSISESPPPYTSPHSIAQDGKTESCDRTCTFETFLAAEHLGEEDQMGRTKSRRRDRLRKWLKKRFGSASSTG